MALIAIKRPARDVKNDVAAGLLHPPPRDPEGPAPVEEEPASDHDDETPQPPWRQ